MRITINDKYTINSYDEKNYTVEELRFNKKQKEYYWNVIGFFNSLNHICQFLINKSVRECHAKTASQMKQIVDNAVEDMQIKIETAITKHEAKG